MDESGKDGSEDDCNLFKDSTHDRLEWRKKIHPADSNIVRIRL